MGEQSVTNVDLRFHTPAEQKRKRRLEHTRVTESLPPSSPWLITVILGFLCLALLVTARILDAMFLQASDQVRTLELMQNEEFTHNKDILKNQSKLQESLKNCTQERNDLQAQKSNISKVANTKGDKCSSCPESWIQHRGQCYHFTSERRTWGKSKEYCSSHGSRLLKIETKEELDFINALVCGHWIGLSRKGRATSWMWEDGTAHSTDLFRVRTREAGACCALMNVGEAVSSACRGEYHWICEKSAA